MPDFRHLDKMTCARAPSQDVIYSASFNPTSGCKNSTLCDGKGGMLVYMDVPSGRGCGGSESSSGPRECDAGCIVGAVLGSVFGAALLGILAFVVYRKLVHACVCLLLVWYLDEHWFCEESALLCGCV